MLSSIIIIIRDWNSSSRYSTDILLLIPPVQVATDDATTVHGVFVPIAEGKMPLAQVAASDQHH